MSTLDERRIEPPAAVLDSIRGWLAPVQTALGPDFVAAYLTGSVLSDSFDARHSHANVLVVARQLDMDTLDAVATAAAVHVKSPRIDPLFVTRAQIAHSLDVFPIEWLDVQERHLRLAGEDVVSALAIPHEALRMQCERELRGKHLRLRQAYVLAHGSPSDLEAALRAGASGFATLFRTLLRLRGESPPAEAAKVIERVADAFALDATALLGPHVLRYTHRRVARGEILGLYRKFLVELDRLIAAIDEMRVP
jgi:hypothetical protein